MARSLRYTVEDLFMDFNYNGSTYDSDLRSNYNKYMDIPLQADVFEVPILAFRSFCNHLDSTTGASLDSIAVKLNTNHRLPLYKTLDRNMRDILTDPFREHRLITIKIPEGDHTTVYYGTQGAVFKDDFTPIVMCSYQIERVTVDNGFRYKLLRPILRIAPTVYRNRTSPMEKYVINKLLNACLEDSVQYPCEESDFIITRRYTRGSVKVEIDDCPFVVRHVDIPSVSTTNQQLLQLAIDHIDELMQ